MSTENMMAIEVNSIKLDCSKISGLWVRRAERDVMPLAVIFNLVEGGQEVAVWLRVSGR